MNTTLPNFTPRHYQPVSFPVMAMLKTAQVHIMEDATRLSLAQGIKELMASKRTANRRENYIESLGHYLGRFAKGRESKMISEIQVFDLELGCLSSQPLIRARRGSTGSTPCFPFPSGGDISRRIRATGWKGLPSTESPVHFEPGSSGKNDGHDNTPLPPVYHPWAIRGNSS